MEGPISNDGLPTVPPSCLFSLSSGSFLRLPLTRTCMIGTSRVTSQGTGNSHRTQPTKTQHKIAYLGDAHPLGRLDWGEGQAVLDSEVIYALADETANAMLRLSGRRVP